MLNPSTADAGKDNPTIRKCIGFATRRGHGGFVVVNLYALRESNPDSMLNNPDRVGRDCNISIHMRLDLMMRAQNTGNVEICLGRTKNGSPKHPLYVPYSAEWQEYESRDQRPRTSGRAS